MRREDHRLLTGEGRYTADFDYPGQCHAAFLRSDRAHADIKCIDLTRALAAPGVLAVLTGRDVAAAGYRSLPVDLPIKDRGRRPLVHPHRPALAQDRVRFVGEPVALVVAQTLAQAGDAVELIDIEYLDQPSLTSRDAATQPGAPTIWLEMPDNVCFEWEVGDEARTREAIAGAPHVTRLRVVNNRLVASPMENRAALALYDPATDHYTIHAPSQGTAQLRRQIAGVLGIAPTKLRVLTHDVGGGFGARTPVYPEHCALLLAAKTVGRPVKWVSTRAETFLGEHHGRDSAMQGELALDRDGRFLALRIHFHAAMGAYLTSAGVLISTANISHVMAGVYRTPAVHGRMTCVMTNTPPVGPYRGAGRPEMAYFIERIVDEAAHEMGLDRAELRRRNFVDAFPYRAPNGVTYDSGEFAGVLERACALSGWNDAAARRAEAQQRGRLYGIGLASFLEVTGGNPREGASLRFASDGTVVAQCGTQSNGQGHETVFPALVAQALGVPVERVRLSEGDHDEPLAGGSSVGSRSLVAAGNALRLAAQEAIRKGRDLAARRFEAAPDDVQFDRGRFRVAGTDRTAGLLEIAIDAASNDSNPLDSIGELDVPPTFPNGCYVAEIEIDPATGALDLRSLTAVNDNGIVKNRELVEGQVHGGIAQAVGQALVEHCQFDPGTGQLLTGSFADYAMPRADLLPSIACHSHEVPCVTNPLGVKGAGECGVVGALPAVMNAVADALRGLGIPPPDMPVTSETLWRAIHAARQGHR